MNKKKLFIILGCAVVAVAAIVLIIVLTGKGSTQDTSSAASGEVSTIEAGTAATTLPADPSQETSDGSEAEVAGSDDTSADGSSAAGSSSPNASSGNTSGTTSGTTSGAGGIETPDDVFDDPVSSTPAAVDEPSDTPSSSSADTPSSSAEQPPVDEPITLPYSGDPIVLPTIKLN